MCLTQAWQCCTHRPLCSSAAAAAVPTLDAASPLVSTPFSTKDCLGASELVASAPVNSAITVCATLCNAGGPNYDGGRIAGITVPRAVLLPLEPYTLT